MPVAGASTARSGKKPGPGALLETVQEAPFVHEVLPLDWVPVREQVG
jgi:hypothetical protein